MIYDSPVAVLVYRSGEHRMIGITDPPPPRWFVPIPRPLSIRPPDDVARYEPILRRVFRLSGRTKDIRYWHVYNGGASKTPRDGFVYLEQSTEAQ